MAKKAGKTKKAGTRRTTDLPPKTKIAGRVLGGGIQPTPFAPQKFRPFGIVQQQP